MIACAAVRTRPGNPSLPAFSASVAVPAPRLFGFPTRTVPPLTFSVPVIVFVPARVVIVPPGSVSVPPPEIMPDHVVVNAPVLIVPVAGTAIGRAELPNSPP